VTTFLWTALVAVALLWPAHIIGPFDGAPLAGRFEAVAIGVAVPALWYLNRRFLCRRWVRIAVVALLVVKAAGTLFVTQQGLCARFWTTAPFRGVSNSIPIDEPTGSLRSWDIRADWRAATPRCTAILDRPYRSAFEFPVWFLNLVDVIRPGRNDLAVDLTGYLSVGAAGTFTVGSGRDMTVAGQVGDVRVASARGDSIVVPLSGGTHAVKLRIALGGEQWRFVPLWNGRDAWTSSRLTMSIPSRWDGFMSALLGFATSALVLLIMVGWAMSTVTSLKPTVALAVWTVMAASILAWFGSARQFERLAGPVLLASVFVPVATRHRNLRGTFVLVGIPWLAFFVSRSLPQIGRVTAYSFDDWLIFQSAAYRIFLNGYWIEGGSPTFYFQPFYRWTAGFLHLLFGDSSVGELYWDAACLLMGALLAFQIVKAQVGFRAGLFAAAATLATCTVGTVWYFAGRGLSEISAEGWAALAGFFLLRARLGKPSAAVAAGVCATLMFYTRLNLLLFGSCFLVFLLRLTTSSRIGDLRRALARVRLKVAATYISTFALGVALFSLRTWWYTGVFSLFYGTSLKVQETGLRLASLGSPAVWAQVSESVRALVWMNDPPSPDPRASLVVAGVVLSLAALLQLPGARRLPLVATALCVAATAGAFVAHAHHYPGRLSIHVMPLATAVSAVALALAARWLTAHLGARREQRPLARLV
jgi:hypothetical protein